MTGNNYAAKIYTMNPIDYDSPTGWLLCGLKLNKSTEDINTLKNLSDGDWDATLQLAIHHGVAPYLYQQLVNLEPGLSINSDTFKKLHQIYLASFARNTRLYHHLSEILTKLQRKNIPVIALKGIHLAEIVYQDIALRPMDDIDILVSLEDMPQTVDVLQTMGYTPSSHFWIETQSLAFNGFPPFVKPQAPIVELHWNIETPTSPFTIDLEGLWQRARPATIAGVNILTLAPEDLLLHQCLHTAYHHKFETGLRPFCDIQQTLQYYQGALDWKKLQLRAQQWRAEKLLYFTLYLTKELLAVTIPREISDNFKTFNMDDTLIAWTRTQILASQQPPTKAPFNLIELWSSKGSRQKLAVLYNSVFPSLDIMATMYPAHPSSKKIYLYYPLRWKDLLQRYGRILWNLLRRDSRTTARFKEEEKGNALIKWLTS